MGVRGRGPSLDRLVAQQRRPVHLAGRVGVVGSGAVQHAAVVPDHSVADRPLVAVDAVGRGRPLEEIGSSARPSSRSMPTTWSVVAPSTSDSAPGAVRPDQRVLLGRLAPPHRQLLGRVGEHETLRGLERVDDPDPRTAPSPRRRGRRRPRRCWRTRSRRRSSATALRREHRGHLIGHSSAGVQPSMCQKNVPWRYGAQASWTGRG